MRAGRRRIATIGLALVALACAASLALAPAAAQAHVGLNGDNVLYMPTSQTKPPQGFRVSALNAVRAAARTRTVQQQRAEHPDLYLRALIAPPHTWVVEGTAGRPDPSGDNVNPLVSVGVGGRDGRVYYVLTGPQAQIPLAFGHLAGRADQPWIWAVFSLMFLAPFIRWRRPWRLLHLDLAVMLAFGISHLFLNAGDAVTSVPLVYPVFAYLLARMLWVGLRPRERFEPLVPHLPTLALGIGLVGLIALRIFVNLYADKAFDIAYAGVAGAFRINHGLTLYGTSVAHLDTYGPVNYIAYAPFVALFPFHHVWDHLWAAHALSITLDLVAIGLLVAIGMRLRGGSAGRRLGLTLAYAWAAYPYTLYAMAVNSNDTLIAVCVLAAILALSSPALRGAFVGLGAAAKFAPAVLGPLFLTGTGDRRRRPLLIYCAAFALVVGGAIALYLPPGGLPVFWHATLGFQLRRITPMSLWGLHPALRPLQTVLEVATIGLATLVAFVPRRRSPGQVAALAAAVLIALQITDGYWMYYYIPWFAGLVLVAVFAEHDRPRPTVDEPALAEPIELGELVARRAGQPDLAEPERDLVTAAR